MEYATSILLAIIFVITSLLIYKWLFSTWGYWTSRGIPSVPGALPMVGNTLSVYRSRENLSVFCKSIYDANRGKSMIGFYTMKTPSLMIRDPELVKTVLQTSWKNFQYNESVLHLEEWKNSRSYFSSKRFKIMGQVIIDVCKKLESHLQQKIRDKDCLELEAKLLFSQYTTEVAVSSIFSIEGNSFENNYRGTLFETMKKTLMAPTKMKTFTQNVIFFFSALRKYFIKSSVPPHVDTLYRHVVSQVENPRQLNDIVRPDVLQLMTYFEEKRKISVIEVLSDTVSFFIESYETNSLTLSFAIYALAKHPKVQTELRREIETVLKKYNGQMIYEAINELFYTEQVINETLRLFPPTGALVKLCTKKCRLQGSDGLAVKVEPNTPVVIPIMGLHMDPQFWDNPENFNPERFRKGNDEKRHKFAFIPFGEGSRARPGMRFAVMQVKAAIATIVRSYRIELAPKMKEPLAFDPKSFMLTASGGFWIRLHPLKDR